MGTSLTSSLKFSYGKPASRLDPPVWSVTQGKEALERYNSQECVGGEERSHPKRVSGGRRRRRSRPKSVSGGRRDQLFM
jgi:hypothetical protein